MIYGSIGRVYFPVTTLGYGRRLGIWVQGCSRHCEGCISPELQEKKPWIVPIESFLAKIPRDIAPDGLTISGGEPFEQAQAVRAVMQWFLHTFNDDILIYTGYTLEELKRQEDPDIDWILHHAAALVDGPFVQAMNDGKGMRGSSNQRLYVFRYPERYQDFESCERKLQCVQERDRLLLIGVMPLEKGSQDGQANAET